jgi:acyl transferase domain-containing protein
MSVGFGAFLPQAELFDAAVFGLTPTEATLMDPQQRGLLQGACQVVPELRAALHTGSSTAAAPSHGASTTRPAEGCQTWDKAVGVYAGVSSTDYARLVATHMPSPSVHAATAGTLSVAPGRVSFMFGLQGPCMAVDTACSSSLVAAHIALEGLQKGLQGCLLAGVNLTLTPDTPLMFQKAGDESRQCRFSIWFQALMMVATCLSDAVGIQEGWCSTISAARAKG